MPRGSAAIQTAPCKTYHSAAAPDVGPCLFAGGPALARGSLKSIPPRHGAHIRTMAQGLDPGEYGATKPARAPRSPGHGEGRRGNDRMGRGTGLLQYVGTMSEDQSADLAADWSDIACAATSASSRTVADQLSSSAASQDYGTPVPADRIRPGSLTAVDRTSPRRSRAARTHVAHRRRRCPSGAGRAGAHDGLLLRAWRRHDRRAGSPRPTLADLVASTRRRPRGGSACPSNSRTSAPGLHSDRPWQDGLLHASALSCRSLGRSAERFMACPAPSERDDRVQHWPRFDPPLVDGIASSSAGAWLNSTRGMRCWPRRCRFFADQRVVGSLSRPSTGPATSSRR